MQLSTQLINFAQGDTSIFDKFSDYWNHWNKEIEKNDVGSFKSDFSLDEKESQMNEAIIDKIIERSGISYAKGNDVATWFNHPLVRYETYAVISSVVDSVLPRTIVDSIGPYTDIRYGGFGDSFAFDIEPNGLFVVSKSSMAKRNSEVRKDHGAQVQIIPEARQLTAGVDLYRVLSGRDSLARLTMKVIRSLETEITKDAYDVFETAMDAADDTATTGLKVTGYTQESLVRLCQQVQAWNNGAKPVIMGTQLAMVNVLPDDANYRYDLQSPYATMGYVQNAFGFDTFIIPPVADFSTQFSASVISNDRLWIVSPTAQKLLKLCFEGNTLSVADGAFDNANLSQNASFTKLWKAGFCSNSVAATIVLT